MKIFYNLGVPGSNYTSRNNTLTWVRKAATNQEAQNVMNLSSWTDVAISSLQSLKREYIFLQNLIQIPENHRNLAQVIVDQNPERNELIQFIKEPAVSSNIAFELIKAASSYRLNFKTLKEIFAEKPVNIEEIGSNSLMIRKIENNGNTRYGIICFKNGEILIGDDMFWNKDKRLYHLKNNEQEKFYTSSGQLKKSEPIKKRR